MRIADLNKRITLQAPTRVSDGMGGHTVTWTDQATVFAAVWPISAREAVKGAQTAQEITHRLRLRYRFPLPSSWRVQFGTRYFAIQSVVCPNEGRRWLDLLCREVAA